MLYVAINEEIESVSYNASATSTATPTSTDSTPNTVLLHRAITVQRTITAGALALNDAFHSRANQSFPFALDISSEVQLFYSSAQSVAVERHARRFAVFL